MTDSEYSFKFLRDPIYGYIGVSKAELEIINTLVFRRLHGIKQLAFSYLVYHTATHTRYEHCLGAMHMVSKMCDQLGIGGDLKRLARMAALLHDIGHGPFSHTFEDVLKAINSQKLTNANRQKREKREQMHERIGRRLIMEDPEIVECLGDERRDIASILSRSDSMDERYNLISDIVSSNLDADKLDYFARDSYNLGVKYGVVDTERILHVLRKDKSGTRVGIHPKGVSVMDSYRLARYMIGKEIYTHRARLAADQMFYRAALAAFDEGVFDRRDFDVCSGSFLEMYRTLDDSAFVHKIMWHGKGKLSRELLDDINRRRLVKACYQKSVVNAADSEDFQALDTHSVLCSVAEEIRGKTGLREHELFAHESDLQLRLFHRRDFNVIDERGYAQDMPLSPIHAHTSVMSYYVFGKADRREEITQMLRDKGIKTDLII